MNKRMARVAVVVVFAGLLFSNSLASKVNAVQFDGGGPTPGPCSPSTCAPPPTTVPGP
jgi:hypothetical protein